MIEKERQKHTADGLQDIEEEKIEIEEKGIEEAPEEKRVLNQSGAIKNGIHAREDRRNNLNLEDQDGKLRLISNMMQI